MDSLWNMKYEIEIVLIENSYHCEVMLKEESNKTKSKIMLKSGRMKGRRIFSFIS